MKSCAPYAIREDRALTAAHVGTGLLARTAMAATKPTTGTDPRVAFAGVTPVANQESHPPRGGSPA